MIDKISFFLIHCNGDKTMIKYGKDAAKRH